MGLAFQGIASTKAVPFWQALISNNLLTTPEFSFFITRPVEDLSVTQEEPGGVFTLGGTNSTLYQGSIDFQTFTSVGNGSYWLQTVAGVTMNGKTVNIGSAKLAAIDTGTTFIAAPSAAVTAIWSAVPDAKPLSGEWAGFWSFPCTSEFTFAISFGGPSWSISTWDMNLGTIVTGGSECVGAIFSLSQGPNLGSQGTVSWIIGDTFLKNVYSVFRASNPPAVGFAQLAQGSGGYTGTPGPTGTAGVPDAFPTSPFNGASCQVTPFGNIGVLATSVLSLLTAVFMLAAW